MNGNLLDTSIIIDVLRGDADAVDFLHNLSGEVFVSVIAVGELLYGASKSTKVEHNIKLVRDVTSDIDVLPIDIETAEAYGQIKTDLVKKGFKIPENDIWIAATAQRNGLALATYDSHFKHISNLEVVGIE